MLNIQLACVKFAARVRADGFLPAICLAARQALKTRAWTPFRSVGDEFDNRYGTDTGGVVNLWQYRIESPNAKYGVSYGSISQQHIEVLLGALPRHATFVDLGCGKGRPLLVAARMGFESLIGVEFVRELAEVAHDNLRKMGVQATVVRADAAAYEFPAGPLLVYLYNPFTAAVMSHVADRLRRREGELWVVYVNPRHGSLFECWMERMPLTPLQAEVFSPWSVSMWHKGWPTQ